MSFTNTVIELTQEEPLTAVDIASKTALSIGYVRTQLRLMELAGTMERVDKRTPIYYRPAPNNPIARNIEEISKAKADLLSPESVNDVGKLIRKYPKKSWPDIARVMQAYCGAIVDLQADNKLVDTL